MAIDATTPTTVNGTFDQWAYEFRTIGNGLLHFGAPAGPQPPIRALVTMTKYRVRADGVQEASPLAGDVVTLQVADLYAAAAADPSGIGAALAANRAAVEAYAREKGAL